MKNTTERVRAPGLGSTLVIVTLVGWSVAASGQPLFDQDDVLELTVRAPITDLMRANRGAPDMPGELVPAGGSPLAATFNKYGISRLRECDLASLRIAVDDRDAVGSPFEGQGILRLVTPCKLRGQNDKYIMLEYLAYRSYALIAETALRVRLAHVQFDDSGRSSKGQAAYAFFIEDIGLAAARHDQEWLDVPSQRLNDLDAAQLTLVTLFQYMVGNTDWSAFSARPDERCCHNIAIFGQEGVRPNTVVPFDLDQIGLVNPPYAAPPDPSLGIRRVTDRKYRGLCIHNDEVPDAVAVFNSKRSALEALFNRGDLPYPKDRQRALDYIEDFYATINDPRKLEKRILGDCR